MISQFRPQMLEFSHIFETRRNTRAQNEATIAVLKSAENEKLH